MKYAHRMAGPLGPVRLQLRGDHLLLRAEMPAPGDALPLPVLLTLARTLLALVEGDAPRHLADIAAAGNGAMDALMERLAKEIQAARAAQEEGDDDDACDCPTCRAVAATGGLVFDAEFGEEGA